MLAIILTAVMGSIPVDYMQLGYDLANGGDINGAVEAFRMVTVTEPENGRGWENHGVALLRKGIESSERGPFRDSAMCFETAHEIGTSDPVDLVENIGDLKDTMLHIFPRACLKEDSLFDTCLLLEELAGEYKASKKAEKEAAKNSEAAKKTLEFERWVQEQKKKYLMNVDCSEPRLRFTVTKEDQKRGFFASDNLLEIRQVFKDCGMIMLQNVYDLELIEELKVAQAKYFDTWYENVRNTTESAQRGKDQFEVWAPLIPPFTSDAFLRSPILLPVIEAIVDSTRLELNMLSSVTSLVGAETQHWHRDAGFLFEYDEFPHELPTYGTVMFVPLDNLMEENGPPEFFLKSHHHCHSKDMVKFFDDEQTFLTECPWVKTRMMFTAEKGSVVLFDYRMMHRGGPNRSNERRPLMYLTWVREWWIDRVNYNGQHTESFDNLSGQEMRKLLSRIDSKVYYEKLDDAVLEKGVDFARSKFHYRSYDYHAKAEL